MAKYPATLVISIYKDIAKLRTILSALAIQTDKEFEIIVSEDGNAAEVATFLQPYRQQLPQLVHLSQADQGFRKNRALNRAIVAARSDMLIFVDGDCVPHPRFIAAHKQHAKINTVCAGRRVELGPIFSRQLIDQPEFLLRLANPWRYLALARAMHYDHIKNYEFGLFLPLVHRLAGRRPIHLVGSNFSCSRFLLEKINGFNEDFNSPGIGEDSDLEWRLKAAGGEIMNIKHLAVQYHLHHQRSYTVSERNKQIMAHAMKENAWRCAQGLEQAKT